MASGSDGGGRGGKNPARSLDAAMAANAAKARAKKPKYTPPKDNLPF